MSRAHDPRGGSTHEEREAMEGVTWRYRCSICGLLLHPNHVAEHTREEKAKPTWPGVMTLDRVDEPNENDIGGFTEMYDTPEAS